MKKIFNSLGTILISCTFLLCGCSGRMIDSVETKQPDMTAEKTKEKDAASKKAPDVVPASWDQRVPLGDEIRENRESYAGGGPYCSYIQGKYIDLYETSEGVTVLEQEGTLWKINVQLNGQKYTMDRLCNLIDDSSLENAKYVSYVNAHQIKDDLYFSKNTDLYSCCLTDGRILKCCSLKEEIAPGYHLAVIGGTENAVLMSETGNESAANIANYVWEPDAKKLRRVQWQNEESSDIDVPSLFSDAASACTGFEGNEIFFDLGRTLYAGNIETGAVREVVPSETLRKLGSIYSNHAQIQDGQLYVLCHTGEENGQGETDFYDMLCRLPVEGVDSVQEIATYKPDVTDRSRYETDLNHLHGNVSDNLQAFYFADHACYILKTHLGPEYGEDEQGSILYTLDMATGELTQRSGLLKGMNLPGQIIVKDNRLYVISKDGREVDVEQF